MTLEGDLDSIADSKGKCLVGKVNSPTCPSSNDCWPFQTTVTFTTTFENGQSRGQVSLHTCPFSNSCWPYRTTITYILERRIDMDTLIFRQYIR